MYNVCVVTSSRAEYYLLKPVMKRLLEDPTFNLKVAVTGSHISEDQGNTVSDIESDGMPIDVCVPIHVEEDSRSAESAALAAAVVGFDEYFVGARPDIVVVLGDRYEMLGVVIAACLQGVPVAHIHGGEITLGAIDDGIRHAITKLSYLHFTCCEEYRNRVIQMGEDPSRVFNVGALGVENALKLPRLNAKELSDNLGIDLTGPFALVTLHPETVGASDPREDALEVIAALDELPELSVIITKANMDAGGATINDVFSTAVEKRPKWKLFANLGAFRYVSAMALADVMLGNTSSGIIEAPAFGVPVVNVGARQEGRIRSANIIDCPLERRVITRSLQKALSDEFKHVAKGAKPAFGDGNTSARIAEVLKGFLDEGIDLKKPFYDLPYPSNRKE